jgi:hypothetical protein
MVIETWMIGAAAGLLSVGGAYGGAKVALNGTRERVKELQEDFEQHTADDTAIQRETIDRLARIETKLDYLKEEKRGANRN